MLSIIWATALCALANNLNYGEADHGSGRGAAVHQHDRANAAVPVPSEMRDPWTLLEACDREVTGACGWRSWIVKTLPRNSHSLL